MKSKLIEWGGLTLGIVIFYILPVKNDENIIFTNTNDTNNPTLAITDGAYRDQLWAEYRNRNLYDTNGNIVLYSKKLSINSADTNIRSLKQSTDTPIVKYDPYSPTNIIYVLKIKPINEVEVHGVNLKEFVETAKSLAQEVDIPGDIKWTHPVYNIPEASLRSLADKIENIRAQRTRFNEMVKKLEEVEK